MGNVAKTVCLSLLFLTLGAGKAASREMITPPPHVKIGGETFTDGGDKNTAALPFIQPVVMSYPNWTPHGVALDTTVILTNNEPDTMFFDSIVMVQTNGPVGAIAISGFPAFIPPAGDNQRTGVIEFNVGGIVNLPGTVEYLAGVVEFFMRGGESLSYFVECWVADSLYPVEWDTVATACKKLTVSSNGNFGHQGLGGVNMDFSNPPQDTFSVYLYDGSPVVGYIKGTDTVVNFSIYAAELTDENSFIPYGGFVPTTSEPNFQICRSGKFITRDSVVVVEKNWYAPTGGMDTCEFIIQETRVSLLRDVTVSEIFVGEVVDWDIPADSGSRNNSGYVEWARLMYQQGCEQNGWGQNFSRYFGGIAMLDCYLNGQRCVNYHQIEPYGAYTHELSTHVYPTSGLEPETLFTYMNKSGYVVSDSECTDVYTAMTFAAHLTLTPADTFVFYTELVTAADVSEEEFLDIVRRGRNWYCQNVSPTGCTCCNGDGLRGNVDYSVPDGSLEVNVADLVYLVNYLFRGGPAPECLDEADTDASGMVNVADISIVVDFLFGGGAPLIQCPD